ncbi:MAG: sulfatase-like hydrolase/transferase [Lentisphaeria bacterium]
MNSSRPPNILFILTDQQRADTLSCYAPGTLCHTPHLDALARQSAIFKNTYTVCAVCSPARASLQTGSYPHAHGVETNIYQRGCLVHELPNRPTLLSRRLQQAGYSIGYTGKWHLGEGGLDAVSSWGQNFPYIAPSYSGLPSDVGYYGDDFPGHGDGGYDYPQFKAYLAARGLSFDVKDRREGRRQGHHTQTGEVVSPIESTNEYFLVERAIHCFDHFAKTPQPWCMQLHFWGPHEPFFAPTEFLELYRETPIPPWPNFHEDRSAKPGFHDVFRRPDEKWRYWEDALRHYYGFMSSIDAQVGRLIAELKRRELYDDTVIIFSTDHGDSQGCHGGIENKSYHLYEETVHIPLLVKPAMRDAASFEVQQLVQTCDIHSTILDLAGLPRETAEAAHGRSLVPLLHRETPPWRDCVVSEGLSASAALCTHRMIRKGDWKYVFYASGTDELYNLRADPWEITNRIADPACAEIVTELQRSLSTWMKEYTDDLLRDFGRLRPASCTGS